MRCPRLTLAQLDSWQAVDGVARPLVDPRRLTIGQVHVGVGAFHRAHQAVFTERAAALTGEQHWGIMGVTGRTDAVVRQLVPQDGLYGVLERSVDSTTMAFVGSLRDVVWPGTGSDRVADTVALPTTRVVTLTITEKGYPRDADGALDLARDAVRHDVGVLAVELDGRRAPEPSRTALGLLTRGLVRRFGAGGHPVTVLSCDNLTDNGPTTARLVAGFAYALRDGPVRSNSRRVREQAARFGAWLDDSTRFPTTMVDRIVPATTELDRRAAAQMSGLYDEGLVVTEPFSQWVIEDRFAGPRPAWEAAGAIVTRDVAAHEQVKLRMLNAAHSTLAYLGVLAGHSTISQAVADPLLRRIVMRMLDVDVLPTLVPPPGIDLADYRDEVLGRFANPALSHTTRQVAMDASQKVPHRFLTTAAADLALGRVPREVALALAAWISVVAASSDPGGPVLDDPLAARLQAAVGSTSDLEADPAAAVDRFFDISDVFPEDLRASRDLRAAVVARLTDVRAVVTQVCR